MWISWRMCAVVAGVTLCVAMSTHAACTYPRNCYTGAELQQIRVWERTWSGRRISSARAEEVKQWLPSSLYDLMHDVERWGESWFEIVPYRPVQPSAGTIACTQRWCGQPSVDQHGRLRSWISGVPFPNPREPVEVAHNLRSRSLGDSYTSDETGYLVDGVFAYDMNLRIRNAYMFFAGRTDVPPVPELLPNTKQIWRAFHMHQLAPPEARNLRIIERQYKDTRKPYDSWYWVSSLRRIRRRSTSERQDAVGGADFCGYDNMGWEGAVAENSYRYLGRQELLMARHQDADRLQHIVGKCLFDGVQRERIKVYVVEAVSKDPQFLYSRMVWYLDPESWQMLYSDRYDREGRLWKVLDHFGFVTTGRTGARVNYMCGNQMIDVQRRHATCATADFDYGAALDRTVFTLQYLQKHAY